MSITNNLSVSKKEYMSVVASAGCSSLRNAAKVFDAALLCYHMEIPPNDAKEYIKTLIRKLNSLDSDAVKQGRDRLRYQSMSY